MWKCQQCSTENKDNRLLSKKNGICVKCGKHRDEVPKPEQVVVDEKVPVVEKECDCENCRNFKTVFEFMGVLVQNQQLLSEQVNLLSQQVDVLMPAPPEPTEEELKAAALALRKQKRVVSA